MWKLPFLRLEIRRRLIAWTSVVGSVAIVSDAAQANPSVAGTTHFTPLATQSTLESSGFAHDDSLNFSTSPLPEYTAEPLNTVEGPALDANVSILWSDAPELLVSEQPSATPRSPEPSLAPGRVAETQEVPEQAPQPLEPEDVPPTPTDPELGTLRLQPAVDPELGVLRLQESLGDAELGELRLEEQRRPTERRDRDRPEPSPPSVYLLGGMNYIHSSNIFSSQVDPVGDSLFIPGLSIYARPQLDSDTYLTASVGGYLVRYVDFPDVDYNELRVRLGLRQILSSRMYGEVSWTNAQLFDQAESDRFLNDHALRLLLVRSDPIASNLSLDSYYQFRISFTNPEERSRISNSLGASLVYSITSDLEAALDYQLTWTTFTEEERDDLYNELIAELRYNLSSTTQINMYGGFSFGDSSRSDINFNSGIFGIGINFAIPLF